jgi:hypothetical protein
MDVYKQNQLHPPRHTYAPAHSKISNQWFIGRLLHWEKIHWKIVYIEKLF